jgi:hypothetical protein
MRRCRPPSSICSNADKATAPAFSVVSSCLTVVTGSLHSRDYPQDCGA